MSEFDYKDTCKNAQRLVRQRKFPDAIKLFKQAAESDTLNPDAHEGMATAYFLMGDLELSRDEFKRVTQLDPRRGRAYINLGAVHNRLGQYIEAAAVLHKAVQKERKSAQAYYNLGIAQKGMKQLSMAVSAYKEAIKLDPEMAEAHQNLANVYLEMKNYRQAIRSFNTALELRPGFERAIIGLKRAQAATAEVRSSFSPFGRLVDEERLKGGAVETSSRRLTSQERFNDRRTLRQLATPARDAAQELVSVINDDFLKGLADLTEVFVKPDAASSLVSASESFLEEYARFKETRSRLEVSMNAIAKHEDEMFVEAPPQV